MAIANPTAELLRSAAGVGYLPLGPGVTPVSPLDLELFQQAAWGYSGVPTPGAPEAAAAIIVVHKRERLRLRPRAMKRS